MRYGKAEVSQPLISRMTLEFGLEINILFGDLEIIGTTPMGGTVAIFHGTPEAIARALQFLKDEHIFRGGDTRCKIGLKRGSQTSWRA